MAGRANCGELGASIIVSCHAAIRDENDQAYGNREHNDLAYARRVCIPAVFCGHAAWLPASKSAADVNFGAIIKPP
jgi:hypothetical protein